MLILLGLLALIFAHITYKDVKVRLVFRRDLIALVCLRIVALAIALIAEYCFEIESVLGFSVDQWGICSFVLSVAMAFIICAFVQGVAYITNQQIWRKRRVAWLGRCKAVCAVQFVFKR